MDLQSRIEEARRRTAAFEDRDAQAVASQRKFIEESVLPDALEERPLRDLLVPHLRRNVEINFQNPAKATTALLAAVQRDTFTVVEPTGHRHHFPYSTILSITEHDGNVTIEVHRQVFAKGSIAIGFSTPI